MVYQIKKYAVITFLVLFLVVSPYVTSANEIEDLADTVADQVKEPTEMLKPFVTPVRQSLQCHTVWKGPSADNDILECVKSVDRLLGDWKTLILPGLNVALLALLLVTFPTLFCCVLCCRCCCTPDSKGSTERARCCIWLWITYALLWSVAVFVLIYSGVGMLVKSAPILLNDTVHGPLDYFNYTAERIIDLASNWSSGKREPIQGMPLDLRDFTAVHEQAMGFVKLAEDYYFNYLDKVSLATYCVASIGFVLLLLLLPFACCHCCIPCFPLLLSCLYWVVGVLFAVLGILVTVLSLLSGAACGELELQHNRMPGVFQWYAVPFCKQQFNFTSINKMVRDAEIQFSHMSCKHLLQWCDTKGEPNITLPGFNQTASNPAAASRSKLRAINSGLSAGRSKLRADLDGLSADAAAFQLPGLSGGGGAGGMSLPGGMSFPGGGGAGAAAGLGGALGTGDIGALAAGGQMPGSFGDLSSLGDISKLPPDMQKTLASGGLPDLKDMKGLGGQIPDIGEFLKVVGQSGGDIRPLMCGMNITKVEQCTDFGSMATVLLTTKVKAFTRACPTPGSSCTLSECALKCKNPMIQNTAAGIIMGAGIARNASIALSYAKPLLECNFVIDKLSTAMKQCNDLKAGSLMLGVGFFIGGVMFGLAIYITFRGACIWGRLPTRRRKDRDPYMRDRDPYMRGRDEYKRYN